MTRKRILIGLTAAAMLAGGLTTTSVAAASGRPCGPPVSTSGAGTLGTPFALKSMHDDDGPGGSLVVGEEFEIFTQVVGQVWTITFADNGLVFFNADDVATATGIREVHATANQPGTQHMTAHAVNHATGEVVDAFVDVPPAPNCGH